MVQLKAAVTNKLLFQIDTATPTMPLLKYKDLVQRNKGRLDFIVIDFCQAVEPEGFFKGEYEQMSRYALQVQKLAQENNVAVLDLSQISNEGIKDTLSDYGFIPMKGSGHLYSSADIAGMLNRKKNDVASSKLMHVDVRKHKYKSPSKFDLMCDFRHGTFQMEEPKDVVQKIANGLPF